MTKGAKLSVLLISLTILFMAALMSGIIKSSHWKIDNISLFAEFKRVNSEQVRIIVASQNERSFFKVNPNKIREELTNIPWVQHVTVNKKWPNSLIIKLIEHKAVATWNQDKLLNEYGEVFKVDRIDDLNSLPKIHGNDNDSKLIWDKYTRFNEIVKNIGHDISTSNISNRGGWKLSLSNGIEINLGSQQIDAKLVRLTDTWSKLLQLKEQLPIYIDLRYTNGYVVKWPQTEETGTEELTEDSTANG
ncbi:MAG: cell division protein FtsQ/DivIB [Marinicellaceae bacterium]